MATQAAQAPIVISQSRPKSWVDYLFYLIFAGAAIWGGQKLYKKWRANLEAGKIGDDPAAQAASTIYDAKNWYGDNEDSAISLAKTVAQKGVDFKDISKSFTKLYSQNINDYLNSFMDADQQTRFFNTLNLTASNTTVIDPKTNLPVPAPIKSVDAWTKGKAVITKGDANIRKTAKWVSSSAYARLNPFYKNNIIGVASINRLIGTATGRTSFDEKAEPVGVLFVEVTAPIISEDNKKFVGAQNVWVAASQATPYWFKEIMTPEGKLKSTYGRWAMTQAKYNVTASISGIGGHGAADFSKEISARETVSILNDKFKEVMTAKRGIILGFPIKTAKHGDKEMVQFQTVSGYAWWVEKSKIATKTV